MTPTSIAMAEFTRACQDPGPGEAFRLTLRMGNIYDPTDGSGRVREARPFASGLTLLGGQPPVGPGGEHARGSIVTSMDLFGARGPARGFDQPVFPGRPQRLDHATSSPTRGGLRAAPTLLEIAGLMAKNANENLKKGLGPSVRSAWTSIRIGA